MLVEASAQDRMEREKEHGPEEREKKDGLGPVHSRVSVRENVRLHGSLSVNPVFVPPSVSVSLSQSPLW